MNKKLMIFVFAALFFISFAAAQSSSELIFKQNDSVNYKFVCLDNNNDFCTSSVNCTITTHFPNGTLDYDADPLTFTSTGFTHDLTTTDLGSYNWLIRCSSNSTATSEGSYEVTRSGSIVSTGQGILYVVIFLITFGLFLLCCIAFNRTEFDDPRDMSGNIEMISYRKYLKFLYGFLAYFMLLFTLYIGKGITQSFLFLDTAYAFFNVSSRILLILAGPGIIVLTLFLAFNIISDKKTLRELERGIWSPNGRE